MFFHSRELRVSAALIGRLADLHPPPPFCCSFCFSTLVSSQQSQLTDAVAREDFTEAASLKRTIKHMRQNCPVFAIERGYRAAVREEDYAAAASFRDQGAGLVGWWCGRGETEDEPGGQYGVMMQITPEHGRYVGRSYSARDLASMQERARRHRSKLSSRRKGSSSTTVASEIRSHVDDDDDHVGVGVFELWLEKDSKTGELRRRAVRVDHFPAGALDGDDAFASEGAKNDDAGTRSRDERSSASGKGFATALGGFPLSGPIEPGTTNASNDGDDDDVPGSRTPNAFAGWRVSNGAVRVSRGETSADAAVSGSNPNPENPFPFDVDGVSMEELLSYERQGFMAEFKNTPGFAETWARLKAEHAASTSSETTNASPKETERLPERLAAAPSEGDPDVFEAFGGKGAPRPGASRREPHDEYFFEKYVINETDGDAGVVDLDDLEAFDDDDDAFDLENALSDDDDDDDDGFVVDLDAAAAALLDGGRGRIDRAAKGLPAAMVADIQRAIEARGMGRAVFPDDGDDEEDDPWAVEEVRIPVEMAADGHHAFRVWSDDDDDDDARASGAVPGSIPLERTLREASATETEIETAVLRGLSDAKARVAEELRRAANDAAEARDAPKTPEKGETETVAVNFDAPGRIEPGTGGAGGASSDESDASKTSAEEKRAAFDAPDAPSTLGGDAAAMRFGAPGSAASVFGAGEAKESTKSKGERFFERLVSSSADTENVAENVEATDEADDAGTDAGNGNAANGTSRRKDVVPPRGFISPASFESDVSSDVPSDVDDASRRLEEEAASALMDALGGDADALPLPGRTRFSRVPESVASRSSSDPFDRLYLGAFGPHGPEVLRLVRGRWGDERGVENNCVTAVKLTGDANVPAGAASFRARVGPGDALDSSFSYPEELGVVTRFKGQGRVAKPGFAERNWVDGELLLLDGRGGQLTGGAELGFVWAVPGERRLLILFSSLELPETTSGSMVLD